MIEDPLPISETATSLGNQGLRKGHQLTAVGEDLKKVFIKKGLTTPSLQLCNPDIYTTPTKETLAQSDGVQTRAAEKLRITERALRYKLKKYGFLGEDPSF